jgi:hypothetical protein
MVKGYIMSTEVTQVATPAPIKIVGPVLPKEDTTGVNFRVFLPGESSTRQSIYLPSPKAPTFDELVSRFPEAKALVDTLLAESFVDVVREQYTNGRSDDAVNRVVTYQPLPADFDAVAALLAALTPQARERAASAKRADYSFDSTSEEFKTLLNTCLAKFQQLWTAAKASPLPAKASKDLQNTLTAIFTGRITKSTTEGFLALTQKPLFAALMSVVPQALQPKISARLQSVQLVIEESARKESAFDLPI